MDGYLMVVEMEQTLEEGLMVENSFSAVKLSTYYFLVVN